MIVAGVVVLLAVVAGFGIKVPYVILRPGPAPNTLGTFEGKKVLTLSGAKTYPTSGGLHFTTVSMVGGPGNRPSLIEYGLAKLDDHAQIYEESQLFAPQTTREQVQQQNEAEMTGSQSSAEVVAARQAGYDVPEMIEIAGISDSASEAKKLLRVKDVIVSVNGVKIADSLSLQREMKKVTPGQKVQLGITRGGKVIAENIEIAGLRRFKDDVTEVREGFECGINLGSFNDLQIGDLIATYEMREKPRV